MTDDSWIFPDAEPEPEPANNVVPLNEDIPEGTLVSVPSGMSEIDKFSKAVEALGVEIVFDTRLQSPIFRENEKFNRKSAFKGWEIGDWHMGGGTYDAELVYWVEGTCSVVSRVNKKDVYKRYSLSDQAYKRLVLGLSGRSHRDFFHEYLEGLPKLELSDEEINDYKLACDMWIEDGFNGVDAQTNEKYRRMLQRLTPLACVWRTMEPGCKVDTFLIIKGPQGTGKDTVLKGLLPDSPGELNPFTNESFYFEQNGKEMIENSLGFVLLIVPELVGLISSGQSRMKSFLTSAHDTARFAYAATPSTARRRFIFAGSADMDEVIPADTAGNRRFAVLSVESSKVGAIEPYMEGRRDEIWRAAVALYRAGVQPGIPRDMLDYQKEDNLNYTRRDTTVEEAYDGAVEAGEIKFHQGYTLTMMAEILGLKQNGAIQKGTKGKIEGVLSAKGWDKKNNIKVEGRKGRVRGYVRPEYQNPDEAQPDLVPPMDVEDIPF